MIKPSIGEANFGAVVGAVAGSAGGLVALGIAPAILTRNSEQLFATPILAIGSWLISAIGGWLIGGQLGPRFEPRFGERNGNVMGGLMGGLAPAIAIALWSWHLILPASPGSPAEIWRYGGIEFTAPAGWTIEKVAGGLAILCPEVEAGWQANLFLQIKEDRQLRSIEQALDDLVPNLRTNKPQFLETARAFGEQAHGLQMGLIEFTCAEDQTPLTQWETVFALDGRKRLVISASAATALWAKYQPTFKAFLNSVRSGGTAPASAP